MSEHLQNKLNALSKKVYQLTKLMNERKQTKVEEKMDVSTIMRQSNVHQFNESKIEVDEGDHRTLNETIDVSLDIFDGLPTFDGQKEKYQQWRLMTSTAMEPLINQQTTMRYYEALLIIRRRKIIGQASDILDDNIRFNFENIINQLDATYIDTESEKSYVSKPSIQREDQSLDQSKDSGNDDTNQNNLVIPQFSKLQHEDTFISEYESNSQSKTLLLHHRKKKKDICWTTQTFWDNKWNSQRQVKSSKTRDYSSEVFFLHEVIDTLIKQSVFKRQNRHNLFKYFRKK